MYNLTETKETGGLGRRPWLSDTELLPAALVAGCRIGTGPEQGLYPISCSLG